MNCYDNFFQNSFTVDEFGINIAISVIRCICDILKNKKASGSF